MKNYKQDLRWHVLKVLQMITLVAAVFATISNIINKRPITIILQPVLALLFIIGIWFYQKKEKHRYVAKLTYMTFFCGIYLPISWYYSPGISSSIGYYAILVIVMSVYFIEHKFELVFPVISIAISVSMIRYELINPEHFIPFPDKETQMNDITINFIIIVFLLFLVINYINRHYVKEKERFYILSITDELTGVYNHRYLLNCLENLVNNNVEKKNISLLFIDVNNFKWINDNFGHLEGDVVLIKLGEILRNNFSICGRFGGDEFVVIIPESDISEAKCQADKLKKEFEKYVHEKNYKKLSLSVGVFSSRDNQAKEIIRKADEYMYNIKYASR
ncbi:MAG TPA: hypothetical protein DIC60_04340 [Lachnospiraceae bacterium]|nr:hypothetical protein [Lachnospiraceae bacterium]